MVRTCECGQDMVRENDGRVDGTEIEIIRHYCDPCGKVITTFNIATDEPVKDAERVLN